MKTPAVLLVLTLASFATHVSAQADAAEAPVVAKSRSTPYAGRWSVGAGFGYTVYSGDSQSGLGGLGIATTINTNGWFGLGLVEFTLVPSLRFGFNVIGSYASTRNADPEAEGLLVPNNTTGGTLGGAGSLRWVINPGEMVEFAPVVALGVGWFHAEGSNGWTSTADGVYTSRRDGLSEGTAVSFRGGFTAEYRLLERLYLRIETYLARIDRTATEVTTRTVTTDMPDVERTQHLTVIYAGVAFQPALQIRILL